MEEIMKVYSLTPPGLMRPGMESEQQSVFARGENINEMPIGMAYVPWQTWKDVYEKDKGLMRGTIFAELDKPFKGVWRR